jgi:hypothetical protein
MAKRSGKSGWGQSRGNFEGLNDRRAARRLAARLLKIDRSLGQQLPRYRINGKQLALALHRCLGKTKTLTRSDASIQTEDAGAIMQSICEYMYICVAQTSVMSQYVDVGRP